MIILLNGPMGSGKSTLGSALAQRLSLPFFDLDEMVQIESGQQIKEIFEQEGEGFFRKLEQHLFQDFIRNEDKGVLALGGGTLTSDKNQSLVRPLIDSCDVYLFTLQVDPSILIERVRQRSWSPFFMDINEQNSLEALYSDYLKARKSIYQLGQQVKLNSSDSLETVVDSIISIISNICKKR